MKRRFVPLTTHAGPDVRVSGVKGELKAGADADILVLDPAAMAVRDVLAGGAVMIRNRVVEKKGYFE